MKKNFNNRMRNKYYVSYNNTFNKSLKKTEDH